MSRGARVDSIDAIRFFRAALVKFQESANSALTDAESEMHQAHTWLENEQRQHWQREIRKCHELLMRAKEALRMKKLFKDSTGSRPTAVDEEKAVSLLLNGFCKEVFNKLPLEFSVEAIKLLEMKLEDSVG